jgi:hypothetical protein
MVGTPHVVSIAGSILSAIDQTSGHDMSCPYRYLTDRSSIITHITPHKAGYMG